MKAFLVLLLGIGAIALMLFVAATDYQTAANSGVIADAQARIAEAQARVSVADAQARMENIEEMLNFALPLCISVIVIFAMIVGLILGSVRHNSFQAQREEHGE